MFSDTGFEPFDIYHCGRMSLDDLKQCLDLINNQRSINIEELNRYIQSFRNEMFDVLKRHDVVVLIVVRQDVLRLGLSKYHGDGTSKPRHLQLELARENLFEVLELEISGF